MNKCNSKTNREKQKDERLGEEKLNNQGCLMKIIKYNSYSDIIIEFQDEHHAVAYTRYEHFIDGSIKNPYYPQVYGVGTIGDKYPSRINNVKTKEYTTWYRMLGRCFDKKIKERQPTYQNASCCKEWLLFENFYEWLHSQENFEKWMNGKLWCLDKDILVKRNKVYSPETCCLVPNNVNTLFVKKDKDRGDFPIGVTKRNNRFLAQCSNSSGNGHEILGFHTNIIEAFLAYKNRKEEIIKQVAEEEYNKGNITQKCYDAMMNYTVEIND